MLSHKQLEKVRRFEQQYGPSEDSFSPDWHAKNPGPGPDAAPVLSNIAEESKTISVCIRHVILKSGDTTLTDDPSYVLPEGASFRE